jgi:hypothetical protein
VDRKEIGNQRSRLLVSGQPAASAREERDRLGVLLEDGRYVEANLSVAVQRAEVRVAAREPEALPPLDGSSQVAQVAQSRRLTVDIGRADAPLAEADDLVCLEVAAHHRLRLTISGSAGDEEARLAQERELDLPGHARAPQEVA